MAMHDHTRADLTCGKCGVTHLTARMLFAHLRDVHGYDHSSAFGRVGNAIQQARKDHERMRLATKVIDLEHLRTHKAA